MEKANDELVMRFDPNVIKHLGIQMYSKLPPVIAELISNSYDAEATLVNIYLYDKIKDEKSIVIEDNGHGMSFTEINDKFLIIGRNRREIENTQYTQNHKRLVIGKKGIGKLSFFGIAKTIDIETIRDYKRTIFRLDWDQLIEQGRDTHKYTPELLEKDFIVEKERGTKITLSNLSRKGDFDPEKLAISLSGYFQIYNELDFTVNLYHNGERAESSPIKNEYVYKNIEQYITWEFPKDAHKINIKYMNSSDIKGKLISAKEIPLPENLRGIALYSRGKLVNAHSFYDINSNSFGYDYITGWLEIDFIDNFENDVISTNRQTLNWESNEMAELKVYIETIIRRFYNYRVEKSQKDKIESFKTKSGLDLEAWLLNLSKHERILAQKITSAIVSADGLEFSKSSELMKYTIDTFQFQAFKDLAYDIENADIHDINKVVEIFKEWELIEAKEMSKIASGRIEAISKFESLIVNNAKEVEQIHPFFQKFPWALDPRIQMFEHEKRYVDLLHEKYPNSELEGPNRRIDFLCTSVSNHRFIIELKRPDHIINLKDIDQAEDYRSFLDDMRSQEIYSPNTLVAYIVGKGIHDDRITKQRMSLHVSQGTIFLISYSDLLEKAKKYHKDFLDKKKELTNS